MRRSTRRIRDYIRPLSLSYSITDTSLHTYDGSPRFKNIPPSTLLISFSRPSRYGSIVSAEFPLAEIVPRRAIQRSLKPETIPLSLSSPCNGSTACIVAIAIPAMHARLVFRLSIKKFQESRELKIGSPRSRITNIKYFRPERRTASNRTCTNICACTLNG